jgi:hypothetical protein
LMQKKKKRRAREVKDRKVQVNLLPSVEEFKTILRQSRIHMKK